MNRSEAFVKLGELTAKKEMLEKELLSIISSEKELYSFLQLPQPGVVVKHKRKYITKEKSGDIRRKIVAVMRDLCVTKGLTWLPVQLIVNRVTQELPNVDDPDVEYQLRILNTINGSPVKHNGMRGRGSCYTWDTKNKIITF